MMSIGFRKQRELAMTNFQAVSIIPSFETEEERRTYIDGERKRFIRHKWKKWVIKFALLSESEMDYLAALAVDSAPQMLLSNSYYDIEVNRLNNRFKGASMTVINRRAERE